MTKLNCNKNLTFTQEKLKFLNRPAVIHGKDSKNKIKE